MRQARAILVAAAATLPAAAQAQATDWTYTATVYGWFTGLNSTVETQFGDLEADLDFADIWDSLDMAFFGGFEARNGRWALVTDLIYSDLSSSEDTPFGVLFRRGEVETRMTLFSAYAAYAVVDRPGLRFDVAGGFRYNDVDIDVRLVGNQAATRSFSSSDSWVDPLVGFRVTADFTDRWYGTAFADVGGFGVDNASDLTWQAYAGVGYRFNDTWSVQGGYRTLSIDRDFDGRDVSLGLYGPVLGVQARF